MPVWSTIHTVHISYTATEKYTITFPTHQLWSIESRRSSSVKGRRRTERLLWMTSWWCEQWWWCDRVHGKKMANTTEIPHLHSHIQCSRNQTLYSTIKKTWTDQLKQSASHTPKTLGWNSHCEFWSVSIPPSSHNWVYTKVNVINYRC